MRQGILYTRAQPARPAEPALLASTAIHIAQARLGQIQVLRVVKRKLQSVNL